MSPVAYLFVYLSCHIFRPKHLTKVHMWAGISKKGRIGICIFEGIMKKELFVSILDGTLLPFINAVYPDEHRFMQDNDPKHTSGCAADGMKTTPSIGEDPSRIPRSESN